MEVFLKYYKYIDAEGQLKKDAGIVTSRTAIRSKRKLEADGSLTTISEEKLHIVSERKPRGANLEEISEEDFKALPAETLVDAGRIERFKKLQANRQKREERANATKVKQVDVSSVVTVISDESFTELNTKIEKGESTIEGAADKKPKKDK